jgi:hypothetical protein
MGCASVPVDRVTPTTSARPLVQQRPKSSAPERIETGDSLASRSWGSPVSVFRVMEASERLQPMPRGPFPTVESYVSANRGPNRDRSGDVRIGSGAPDGVCVELLAKTSNRAAAFWKRDRRRRSTKVLSLTVSPLPPVENTWPPDDRSLIGSSISGIASANVWQTSGSELSTRRGRRTLPNVTLPNVARSATSHRR